MGHQRQAARGTNVFYPGPDYSIDEHGLGTNWIDGKPMFRCVIPLTGANNTSEAVVVFLIDTIDTLINASWVGETPTKKKAKKGTTDNGVEVENATGNVKAFHQGSNFTGERINALLEYTKLS